MAEQNAPEEEVFEGEAEAGGPTIGSIRWVRDLLQRAPWWAISAIFHFILLLAATVIGMHTSKPPEEKTIEMRVANVDKVEKLRLPEKRSTVERKGLPGEVDDSVTDPAIYFPEAEESDHNESADGEDYGQMKGQSLDFISSQTGSAGGIRGRDSNQQAVYDSLGVGGGGGGAGRYGGRFGGKRNLRARGGGGGTEAAVIAGLKWLARHQDADGKWSTDRFDAQCGGGRKCSGGGQDKHKHDTGLTGLALLAFLGAGYLPTSRYNFEDPFQKGRIIRFADTVRKGLAWLKDTQDPEGCFPRQEGEFMYDHAIATLAMAEAAWLCVSPLYKEPAQRGIDFLVKAQNPGFVWRYSVRPGDNDTSVTGWAVMALKSAEMSGLSFPPTCYEGVRAWLSRVTNSQGKVGYESPGDAGSVLVGINEKWTGHPAMTAVGLLTKIFVDKKQGDPWMKIAAADILKDLPTWDSEHKTIDFYYWYYAALAVFQYDAPSGPTWKAFNESMKKSLVPYQHGYNVAQQKDCADGSWDPAVDKWGYIGGRVYATAINVLTLEVYYRYANVFGARGGAKS